jgi:endonuclease/exonuclease/phosphatase family metal-dependent hydrolase
VAGHEKARILRAVRLRALTWNLYHGRDRPPDPALFTWRSRLLGVPERNETHIQVNRELLDEFATVLAGAGWDVALLQECPPRWIARLARESRAAAHLSLTSRNSCGSLRAAAARRNPDLVGSAEGGSNAILVRGQAIVERGELTIRERPALRLQPERRTMAFVRLASGPCVANLHASNAQPSTLAENELGLAARRAVEWAGGAPLILGGDFNLRPDRSPIFKELEREYGLRFPTGPASIDHLLARGLVPIEAPAPWRPERSEVREDGLAIRLSDHAPVEATLAELPASVPR